MDWHGLVGMAAGILQVSVIVPYARDILRGSTRPNAVSTGLWTLLGGVAVAAQLSAGASWSVLLVIGVTFNAGVITFLALTGYGYAKYGRVDWICLVLGIAAIIAWATTHNPVMALFLVVTASVIAGIPTVVKTIRDPKSEHTFSWFLVFVASTMAIVSTTRFDLQNLLYPITDWLENVIILSISFFGQRLVKSSDHGGMSAQELKQQLTDEGFVHVFDWHDEPGTQYEAHSHKGQVSMYIIAGGLTFHFGEEVVELGAGDRFDVPIGKEHVATVGPLGCTYVVGEMIEGDS